MKLLAILMLLVGIASGAGAAHELWYVGPETREFWVGVFATPAGFFFAVAGILLWRRGLGARGIVLIAALILGSVTIAAVALHVMGPPAALIGVVSSLVVAGWSWRSRAVVV